MNRKSKLDTSLDLGTITVLDMSQQVRVIDNEGPFDPDRRPMVPVKLKTRRTVVLCIAIVVCVAGAILIALRLQGII